MRDNTTNNRIMSEAKGRNNPNDTIILFLSVLLIASFYIFESRSYGKYILFGITIMVLLFMAMKQSGKLRVKLDPFHFWIGGFALFCFASAIWAENGLEAISKGLTITELLICIGFIYLYFRDYGGIESLLNVIKWSGYTVMIYTIFYLGVAETIRIIATSGRLLTSFSNRNGIAMIMMFSLIITIYQWFFKGFKLERLLAIPELVFIVLIGSRKAFVGAILGVILLYLYKVLSERKIKSFAKSMILLIVIVVITKELMDMNVFSFVSHRMQSIFNFYSGSGYVDNSTTVRNQMRLVGMNLFKSHPILGIGMGNSYLHGVGDYTYYHNNYVEILSSGGILGFLIYYGMYAYVTYNLFKNKCLKYSEITLVLIIMIVNLVMDYGSVSYYSKSTYVFFALFFLSVFDARRNSQHAE